MPETADVQAAEKDVAMTLEERLEKIESLLVVLVERQQVREWYSAEEFARIVGRAAFTVREWCRNSRINADKKESGRGAHASWAIPHSELLRFQRDGLLPVQKPVQSYRERDEDWAGPPY